MFVAARLKLFPPRSYSISLLVLTLHHGSSKQACWYTGDHGMAHMVVREKHTASLPSDRSVAGQNPRQHSLFQTQHLPVFGIAMSLLSHAAAKYCWEGSGETSVPEQTAFLHSVYEWDSRRTEPAMLLLTRGASTVHAGNSDPSFEPT